MSKLSTPELNKAFNQNRGFSLPTGDRAQGSKLHYIMLAALVLLLLLGAVRILFQGKQKPESVQVVAAGQDIPAGCRISFSSLHYLTIPRRYAAEGMYSSYEQLVGKTTRAYIRKGNPIQKSELLTGSIAESLPKDKRAITLRLDPESQVDHALQCGDKVDVIVSSSAQLAKGKSQKLTKTVCQNLTVILSTPREQLLSSASKSSDANRVTLAASSSDCEKLSEASETGKIRLVLRSPAATNQEYLPGSDESDLIPAFALKKMAEEQALANSNSQPAAQNFFAAAPPPPPQVMPDQAKAEEAELKPAPLQWVVEMFSGSRKESYAIPIK